MYTVSSAKNGSPSMEYSDGAIKLRIHSAFSPEDEAAKSTASFSTAGKNIIIIAGAGLGYHVRALKDKFPQTSILVIEHDTEVLNILKNYFPATYDAARIVKPDDDLSFLFESEDFSSFRGFAHYIHRPSYQINKEYYDRTITEINKYATSKMSDLLTRFEFEERWVENIISNSGYLSSSGSVSSFFGKFSGYPGIIVSAGPSLRKNLSVIKSLENKALIVAVDTAFPVLRNYGINPHFVMTLDAQKHSVKHFLGTDSGEALLIADIVSCPDVLHHYRGGIILSTTSKFYTDSNGASRKESTPFASVIEKYCGSIGDIQSGGSVATSAFDFLLNAGCSQIILFGQDLAYTGREIHSSGTHHNRHWLTISNRFINLDTINMNVIRKRKIKYMLNIRKERIVSDFVLNLYKDWFEDASRIVKIPVINCGSEGAVIEGAENIMSDDLFTGSISWKDPSRILLNTGKHKRNCSELISLYKKVFAFVNEADKFISSGNTAELFDKIEEDPDLSDFFSIYLKKTKFILTRNNQIQTEKSSAMFSADIRKGVLRLKKVLSKALSIYGT